MISLVIIEDEPAIRKEIEYLLGQEPDTELLGWADDVKSAVKLIIAKQPDVILMDIQLRSGNAFDVLKALDTVPQNIIFITAYNQFAIRAIKYGALDYLLKPIVQEELVEALNRFRRRRDNNPHWVQQLFLAEQSVISNELPEHIAIHSINTMRIVLVRDILYCKGDGPYTYFNLKNGEKHLVSKPLKYYEDLLPAPYFLRTHQSFLVNREHVIGLNRSETLLMKNQEEIPVSIRKRNFVLQHLLPQ